MEFVQLRDRGRIEAYLRQNADIHVYSLGDLDDGFWPYSRFWGAIDGDDIQAVCLEFSLYAPPIVLAISEPGNPTMAGLLDAVSDKFPDFAETHFSPDALNTIKAKFETSSLVPHWKMALKSRSSLDSIDVSAVRQLNKADLPALEAHFESVYAGREATNVFYPSMLDVGPYFGVEESGQIISSAGVHVYSPTRGAAAIANVATRPEARGQGLATSVVARLATELMRECQHIGLNVVKDNEPAIRAYKRAGFEIVAEYYEGYITRHA